MLFFSVFWAIAEIPARVMELPCQSVVPRRLALFVAALHSASGHGAVTVPPPRNAIDSDDEAAQKNATYPYDGHACPMPNGGNGTSGANGQACYWFSNGASIGCPIPDATTRGPIPSVKCVPGSKRLDGMCARKMDTCGRHYKAQICDKKLRTVNTQAECGAADDWYYYSPWRAPGSAGVFDSCGLAGGHHGDCDPQDPARCFGGEYVTTAHAMQGDRGSALRPRPTGTTWVAGASVEVAWTVLANHGALMTCPYMRALILDEHHRLHTCPLTISSPCKSPICTRCSSHRRRIPVPSLPCGPASNRGVLLPHPARVCRPAVAALGRKGRQGRHAGVDRR